MKGEKKKVTMKDIADRLNISVNAVSLALNNKPGISDRTRQMVLKVAEELEYMDGHLSLIRRNQLNNICMMIEEKSFRDTRFYSRVILGIENEAKRNGYDLIVNFIDNKNYIIPSSIEQRKVGGIIIVGFIDDEYLRRTLSYGIPLILVDHASFSINTDAVLTQNTAGSYLAVQYLVSKGHKKIGFFGEKNLTLSFNERWIGYSEAMRKYGISVIDDFCLSDSIEDYALRNDFKTVAGIIKGMKRLPTAWICANDSAAFTLINALNFIGLNVPDDISIIGFDDIDLCRIISPNLTTIKVDKELMGTNAVGNLLKRMENREAPTTHIRMAVNLIERNSVKDLT